MSVHFGLYIDTVISVVARLSPVEHGYSVQVYHFISHISSFYNYVVCRCKPVIQRYVPSTITVCHLVNFEPLDGFS
jgi:hypothetical protein